MKDSIYIGPRYVNQDASGLRPFQRQALEAIKHSDARLIFACPESLDDARDKLRRRVEAPAGTK